MRGTRTRVPIASCNQVAGVDLEELIRQTQAGWTREQPVADFEAGNERVQIFLDGLPP